MRKLGERVTTPPYIKHYQYKKDYDGDHQVDGGAGRSDAVDSRIRIGEKDTTSLL